MSEHTEHDTRGLIKNLTLALGEDFSGRWIERPLYKMFVAIENTNLDSDRYVAHQYIVKHYGENGEFYV